MAGGADGGLAHEHVLDQADGHADGGEAEAPVEALHVPQQAGEQRAEQGADVDAHVEDGETGVAARVLAGVQLAEDDRRRGLQAAGAQGHEDQADGQAGDAGQHRQRNVAQHDQDRRVEQRLLGTQEAVGDPRADQGGHVDQAAVRADEGGGDAAVHAQSAVGDGVVHVEDQDALHAVEAEALPHLHAEQVGQAPGLAEERSLLAGAGVRAAVDGVHRGRVVPGDVLLRGGRLVGGRAIMVAWGGVVPGRVR